jgi:hypothetical protein
MNPMISDSAVTLYVKEVERETRETNTILVVAGSDRFQDVQCIISNYDEICKSLTKKVEKFPYTVTEAVGTYFMETPIVCGENTDECFALNTLTWKWNSMPKMNASRRLPSSAVIPESKDFCCVWRE